MNTILIAASGLCLAVSTPASAVVRQSAVPNANDPAELIVAHSVIEILFPPMQRQAMMDKMMADLMAPIRQNMPTESITDPGLLAIMNGMLDKVQELQRQQTHKHFPAILDAMAIAYSNEFTLAELKDVYTFAQTSSGRRYLSRSSALVSDPAMLKVYSTMIVDSRESMKPTLEQFSVKVREYLKAHPEVAKKMAAKTEKN
jgi:hypothetical protein